MINANFCAMLKKSVLLKITELVTACWYLLKTRSKIKAPNESPYMISYLYYIQTICLSLIISKEIEILHKYRPLCTSFRNVSATVVTNWLDRFSSNLPWLFDTIWGWCTLFRILNWFNFDWVLGLNTTGRGIFKVPKMQKKIRKK